ncbi:MAG: binding 1 protein [Patescibacteria group bacterium]|nr:binding 1 protein [Patescibacteria group bacterium]
MNKYIKTITISALFLSFVAITPVLAQAQVNGDDDTVAAAPSETVVSNGDDETAGSSANTDATLNGSDDTTGSAASTGGSNTGGASNGDDDTTGSPASTGGTNTGGVSNGDDDTSGSIPSNPSNPSNPSDGGSNGSSGGSSNRTSRNSSTSSALPVLINIANCSYITDYMKLDGTNNTAEVTKLQTFLKNTEKLNVDINGKFDQKTFDAVKAFQAKYVNEIMAPWGVNTPTGQVFFTTKKKINEIYCKSTFTLTPAQIAQIEAYRKGIVDGTVEVAAEINATGTTPLAPEVGTNENSQTAAVGSFASRIWNFVKWLFGY